MRSILTVIIVALLLAGGVVVASPYVALNGLRDALESGDADDISERVDFPVLRRNIKDQLSAMVAQEIGSELDDSPFAALAAGVVSTMVDNTLDAVVTPVGIARLVAGERAVAARGSSGTPSDSTRRNLLSEARVVHDSLDRVTVWVPNDYGNEVQIVMQRYGVTWKLTNVVIPDVESQPIR